MKKKIKVNYATSIARPQFEVSCMDCGTEIGKFETIAQATQAKHACAPTIQIH